MRRIILFFVFIFVLNTYVYGNEKVPSQPNVYADGAVLIDGKSGRILWGKNEEKELAMASTTKIMTAIIAIESGKLDETVIVVKEATRAPEVKLHISENEEFILSDLLYPLMLESSNDVAVAIANHVSGSTEEFCRQMTLKAKELGAKNTVFKTPNGLDKEDHHSTALDMALISMYAMENPTFVDIINTPSKTFSSNLKSYSVNNKNKLLTSYDGANGIKTGFTNLAGNCFVGSAIRNDIPLISVVLASGWGAMGREQKWVDTKEILNYGFQNYFSESIIEKDKILGEINIVRSKTSTIPICYGDEFSMILNENEKNNLDIEIEVYDSYMAPIEKNAIVGRGRIKINGEKIGEVPIVTTMGCERHDLKTKLEQILNTYFGLSTNSKPTIILPEF